MQFKKAGSKLQKARKRLKTLAGRLIRELRRELPGELLELRYRTELIMYEGVLAQKRRDKSRLRNNL